MSRQFREYTVSIHGDHPLKCLIYAGKYKASSPDKAAEFAMDTFTANTAEGKLAPGYYDVKVKCENGVRFIYKTRVAK